MNILALDIATKTGFAYNSAQGFDAGTWVLSSEKYLKSIRPSRMDRRNDPRVHSFCRFLEKVKRAFDIDVVVFEDVQFASSTMQVQLWASLRAVVWLAFPPGESNTVLEAVPVGTLKKFATGSGAATKEMMAKYLKLQHPELYRDDLDDNGVDATWLWLWAKERLGRMKTV